MCHSVRVSAHKGFHVGMPPPTCAKCRQAEALEGDTWCLGCSSWDALGRELSGHWDAPGARILAADLVVSCVRQVRGLRGFAAGLVRQAAAAPVSGIPRETRSRSPAATTAKSGPPAKRPLPAPPPLPPPKAESGSEDEEDCEEEPEEESPSPEHRPLGGRGDRRPPEPDHPPRGVRSHSSRHGAGEDQAPVEKRRHRGEGGDSRRKKRKGSHRGGRKHQRLHRLYSNPLLRVHRQLPGSYLELGSLARGRDALDRL